MRNQISICRKTYQVHGISFTTRERNMAAQVQATPQSKVKSKGQGSLKDVDAFIFDVFGTVVDWRTNVVKEVQELGMKHGTGSSSFLYCARVKE